MKITNKLKTYIRLGILLLLLITVTLFQNVEGWGSLYADEIYPSISFVLSSISNIFPFSIGELFVPLAILLLIGFPFYARKKKTKWKIILFREVEWMMWIYVWFYIAWGLNYSQDGLLSRLNIQQSKFSEELFMEFAEDYVSKLNSSYEDIVNVNSDSLSWRTDETRDILMTEVVDGYHSISSQFAINKPVLSEPRVKDMMFSPLISMFGISGSMAPFFCEFTVNTDVLPFNYPATYAHEMAHQLGITSEAEANFYAYQVCTRSQNSVIRFSGYNSILMYTLGNARSVMDKEQYKRFYETVNPAIIVLAQERAKYWEERYSPLLGDIQEYAYNVYLKSNKISSGTKNYSQVIGMLISVKEGKVEK